VVFHTQLSDLTTRAQQNRLSAGGRFRDRLYAEILILAMVMIGFGIKKNVFGLVEFLQYIW
jgi:hypothetical protein